MQLFIKVTPAQARHLNHLDVPVCSQRPARVDDGRSSGGGTDCKIITDKRRREPQACHGCDFLPWPKRGLEGQILVARWGIASTSL